MALLVSGVEKCFMTLVDSLFKKLLKFLSFQVAKLVIVTELKLKLKCEKYCVVWETQQST